MKFSDVLYHPQGKNRPSTEDVLKNLGSSFENSHEFFGKCKVEHFEIVNNGIKIFAEYRPVLNARGCVIMAHGYGQNRYILMPQEQIFRSLGFSLVLFDQRAFGLSEESTCTFGYIEAQDVARLIVWVKENVEINIPIILFGVSMGAATVLNALKYSEHVDYVIADSGFSTLRNCLKSLHRSLNLGEIDDKIIQEFEEDTRKLGFQVDDNSPVQAIQYKTLPICITHGLMDQVIDVEHARHLFQACHHSESHLELFEGKDHALCVTDLLRYENMLKHFLRKLL